MDSLKTVVKNITKGLTRHVNFSLSVTRNNKRFQIPVINNIGLGNFNTEEDSWFLRLIKKLDLPPQSEFIDVGVNVGQSLITFRSCYDNPYWGFEPSPHCVFYVNRLIELNKFRNTHILPVGLSSSSSVLKFFSKDSAGSGATMVEDLRPGYYNESDASYIPVFRFDDLNLAGFRNVSFVKIDVEGAELEVLKGLADTITKCKPIITCEVLDCHSAETNLEIHQKRADSLMTLMKNLGYDVYRIKAKNGLDFEKVEEILLKQYSSESQYLNDYLFLPADRKINELLRK